MPLKKARFRISDYNQKRKSRLQTEERKIRMVSLSLTSMVDMFAILVIFLLVNSTTVSQWIEVSHGIELPKAGKTDQPKQAATVQVSMDGIYGEKQLLAKTPEVFKQGGMISSLQQWLKKEAKKDGYVNLVAHEKVPFGVIRKVIGTCQDSGFGKVNLAVQPRAEAIKTQ